MHTHLDELEMLYSRSEMSSSDTAISYCEERSSPIPQQKRLFSHLPFSFQNINRKLNWFSEIKTLIILFIIVFSGFFFFTNAKLVVFTFTDMLASEPETQTSTREPITEHGVADLTASKQQKLIDLEKKFASIQQSQKPKQALALTMKEFLDAKQETHSLNFNTLPPTNRLIIPDLKINAPLIDIPSKGAEDFSQGNFDEELMQGVVKYPTTPTPWHQGNSLLFGHTSTEWWKHNEYGFIFRNLPKLKVGQQFQVVRKGQLTTYEMVERKILLPKQVSDYYHEFQEKGEGYLTLMGCYPIGSDAKRMMVVAKKVENP